MKQEKWKDIQLDIEEIRKAITDVKNSVVPELEKNQMLEDLGKTMSKLKNHDIAIFTDKVFYGEAPIKLLRDPAIKLQAKGVYCVLNSYANSKELPLNPKTFVSIERLTKDTGLSRSNIMRWITDLKESGWLTVHRRGFNMSNWYILHSKKRNRKN